MALRCRVFRGLIKEAEEDINKYLATREPRCHKQRRHALCDLVLVEGHRAVRPRRDALKLCLLLLNRVEADNRE